MAERLKHSPDFDPNVLVNGVTEGKYVIESGRDVPPPDWLLELKQRVTTHYNFDPELDQVSVSPLPKEIQPKRHTIEEVLFMLKNEHAPPYETWEPKDPHKMKGKDNHPNPPASGKIFPR